MSEAFDKFKKSTTFVVVTTVFPVVAVVATVMIYINSEALRDQASQHKLEILSARSRIEDKSAQILLLNEQIKQKTTQAEILKSQVELLQKVNTHHNTLSNIEIGAREKKIKQVSEKVVSLQSQINAFESLSSKFGNAGKIAETISDLRIEIKDLRMENRLLADQIAIYEPSNPVVQKSDINEGGATTFLNGNLTVGLEDAYGTWGYINISNLAKVVFEREEIRPGKNISIVVQGVEYVIVVDSITEKSIGVSLLKGAR